MQKHNEFPDHKILNQQQIDHLLNDAIRQLEDPAYCFENGFNLLNCARAGMQAPDLCEPELNGILHAISQAEACFKMAYYRYLYAQNGTV